MSDNFDSDRPARGDDAGSGGERPAVGPEAVVLQSSPFPVGALDVGWLRGDQSTPRAAALPEEVVLALTAALHPQMSPTGDERVAAGPETGDMKPSGETPGAVPVPDAMSDAAADLLARLPFPSSTPLPLPDPTGADTLDDVLLAATRSLNPHLRPTPPAAPTAAPPVALPPPGGPPPVVLPPPGGPPHVALPPPAAWPITPPTHPSDSPPPPPLSAAVAPHTQAPPAASERTAAEVVGLGTQQVASGGAPNRECSPAVAPGPLGGVSHQEPPRTRKTVVLGAVSALAVLGVAAGAFLWFDQRDATEATPPGDARPELVCPLFSDARVAAAAADMGSLSATLDSLVSLTENTVLYTAAVDAAVAATQAERVAAGAQLDAWAVATADPEPANALTQLDRYAEKHCGFSAALSSLGQPSTPTPTAPTTLATVPTDTATGD